MEPRGKCTRGGDSTHGSDGDDGDGQGGLEWAGQHRPQGEAPISAPQAEKILSPESRFLRKTRQKFIRVPQPQSFCRAHSSDAGCSSASAGRPHPAVADTAGARHVPTAVQPCFRLARRPDSRSHELAQRAHHALADVCAPRLAAARQRSTPPAAQRRLMVWPSGAFGRLGRTAAWPPKVGESDLRMVHCITF